MIIEQSQPKHLPYAIKELGLTAEEVEKYITQIAFSGAEEFVNKYKDKTAEANSIIGHFGLGFLFWIYGGQKNRNIFFVI